MTLERELVAELLLDDVADHPLRLRTEDVEGVGVDRLVRRSLERKQADLRSVAVGDHELMLERDGRKCLARGARVLTLVLGGESLAPTQQRVASECDDDAHRQCPNVATMTALIVCIRFSASSQTSDAGDSKTSSLTSSDASPNFSKIS